MQRVDFGSPPTIGHLQRQGVGGLRVSCRTEYCVHSAALRFDAIGLPAGLPFPAIEASGRLVCSACGGRRVSTTPDWPAHPQGGALVVGRMMPPKWHSGHFSSSAAPPYIRAIAL